MYCLYSTHLYKYMWYICIHNYVTLHCIGWTYMSICEIVPICIRFHVWLCIYTVCTYELYMGIPYTYIDISILHMGYCSYHWLCKMCICCLCIWMQLYMHRGAPQMFFYRGRGGPRRGPLKICACAMYSLLIHCQ